jgi:signal transduction histidine kinase
MTKPAVKARATGRVEADEGLLWADIAEIASASLDLEQLFRRSVGRMRESIGYQVAQLSLVDMERKLIAVAFRDGDTRPDLERNSREWPLEGSMAESALHTGHPIAELVSDPEATLRRYPRLGWSIRQGFRSILAIPLQVGRRPVGVIYFLTSDPDAYTERHLRSAESLASYLATPVEHARLYSDARRDAEERTALAEIGRIATSSVSLAGVYSQCAAQIRRLLPFDRLSIATVDHEHGVMKVAYSYSTTHSNALPEGSTFPLAGSLSGAAMANGRGLIVDVGDPSTLEAYPVFKSSLPPDLRTAMVVPMRIGGSAFGVLGAAASERYAFTQRHLWIAQQVADQLAGPVANAALFELGERQRRESEMLAAVGRIVSSSLDSAAVYRQCAMRLREQVSFDTLIVVTVDSGRRAVRIEYLEGVKPDGVDTTVEQPLAGTMTHRAMETGQAVLERVRDPEDTLRRLPGTQVSVRAGFRALICAPLIVSDVMIGAIHLRAFDPEAYSERHVELVKKFALQIAPAIQNARLHEAVTAEKEQRTVAAEERARRAALEVERDELLKQTEARRKLLTLVSHELKTPLSATMAFIELLKANRAGNLKEPQLRQLAAALVSTRHLEMIVNDLLDLSRIDAGTFRLAAAEFDLRQAITEVTAAMAPIFEQRGQKLKVNVGDQQMRVFGDRDRLVQVVSNLLSNASKFSPRESEVQLQACRMDDCALIQVTDHGIGMSQEDQERLFRPFLRADNAQTRAVPGTGLGLYIADSIVRLHGGTIRVQSTQRAGSTFTVELPASRGRSYPA